MQDHREHDVVPNAKLVGAAIRLGRRPDRLDDTCAFVPKHDWRGETERPGELSTVGPAHAAHADPHQDLARAGWPSASASIDARRSGRGRHDATNVECCRHGISAPSNRT